MAALTGRHPVLWSTIAKVLFRRIGQNMSISDLSSRIRRETCGLFRRCPQQARVFVYYLPDRGRRSRSGHWATLAREGPEWGFPIDGPTLTIPLTLSRQNDSPLCPFLCRSYVMQLDVIARLICQNLGRGNGNMNISTSQTSTRQRAPHPGFRLRYPVSD